MEIQRDPEGNEIKHLLEYAELQGKHILEIGCGEGRLTWRYAGSAGRVTGIDLERDGLRVASVERPADLEHIVAFAQADSIRLPFGDRSFEAAILAWSF